MQVHESLSMDTQTTFSERRGYTFSRTTLSLFAAIFFCSLIAAGFIVYNFAACPQIPFETTICDHTFQTSFHTHKSISSEKTSTDSSKESTEATIENDQQHVDVRLPTSIKPFAYNIHLTPFLVEKNFTFNGIVKIYINVIEDTWNITLHATAMKIRKTDVIVQLYDTNSVSNGETINTKKHYFVEQKQFFVIQMEDILKKNNNYTIEIKYIGELNDYLQGFYRSSYMSGNETRWVATTQFQPTDARRAFPCFDEPELKAKFNLSIARPKNMMSISNMPKIGQPKPVDGLPDYLLDVYQESLPMSTYLVAFVVSDFVNKTSGNFGVWARSDAIHAASYALEIGPKILKFLENFFDIDYPLPKMDMIALPDFSAGAMENWGLITYRETAMLYDEGVSGNSNKQRVATVVAHELAHQWFGNLVTPSWWSDLWLNEGFASYMEYLGVDAVEPSWKSMDQFVVNELQNVFSLDALSSSHQISVKVDNPDEINDIFDRISYGKGATIIRMMDHFLTTPIFKGGLTNYLKELAYSSSDQDDLWSYLTDEARYHNVFDNEISVKEIMDTWTLQTGFPVVTVTRNYEDKSIDFKQTRFVYLEPNKTIKSQPQPDPLWWIPLTYTTMQEMDFNNTRPSYWIRGIRNLTINNLDIKNYHWIIVNLQQTSYYRVNYDKDNWKMISVHLRDASHFKEIVPSNRAQLLDDAMNLARGGLLDYRIAMDLTRYLELETDYVPWKAAIQSLNFIDSMLMKGGEYNLFKKYFLSLIERIYNEVGLEDVKNNPMLTVYKRVDILTAACHLGQKQCVNECISKFHTWMHEVNPEFNNPISPNLKSIIYCTAIKYGDQLEWDFAWERYQKTIVSSEKEILLSAMGCSRETWILTRYLQRSIDSTSGIRKQDVFRVFGAVSNNVLGQPIAYNYIRNNWKVMKDYLGSSMSNLNTILKYSTRRLNTVYELEELNRFAENHMKETGRTMQQAIEKAEANIDWMNKNYQTIVQWLGNVTYTS